MFAAKNMQQLEELTIEGCPELRHVMTSDAEDGANTGEELFLAANNSHLLFPCLKKLRICGCPKLQVIFSISSAPQNEIQIVLPHLLVFELGDLENLLEVLPQNYASGWPSVRTLKWWNCPKMTIPCFCLELRQQSRPGNASLPCSLVTLQLEGMENLTEVCRGEPPLDFFKKLEKLYIWRCPQLHNIFPRQCSLGNLKTLTISGSTTYCRVLFSMVAGKTMQQLEELTIDGCPELRHVMTSDLEDGANTREEISLAANNSHLLFPSLKKLRISRCPKMQVIFSISSAQQNEIHMVLPRLQVFILVDLENLLEVLPQNYASRWPSVTTLEWRNCPKLTTPWIGLEPRQQVCEVLPQNYASGWPSVTTLEWSNCPKLTTPWIGLELRQQDVVPDEDHQKLLTLELQTLTLIDLSESMMMWFGPNAVQVLSFQFLQELVIGGLKEKKFFFSMAVLRSLSKLTSLGVGNCDELVEIIAENEESKSFAPDEVLFPKLRYLKIKRCNKLKSLFSIRMIKALPQLTTLHVKDAAQLREIFGQISEENIVNETETVVPNLKEIKFKKLPSFVNIYHAFMMHKVKLKDVRVNGCLKFTSVLGATQVIPIDHRTEEKLIVWPVALTVNQLCGQQMCPEALKVFLGVEEFDLRNSGVEGILQLQLAGEGLGRLQQSSNVAQQHFNSNLRGLYLYELTELRFIWSGPTQYMKFHNLTSITVNGCPKLKTVFPAGIVGSLQNLEGITICNCEELEQIFELQFECFPEMNDITVRTTQFLKFHELSGVTVDGCSKLKTVFPSGVVGALQNLMWLTICNCDELEEISESQFECFPRIFNVTVRKCEKLKCIFYADCMASRHYASLRYLIVSECSQLERIYGLKCTIEASNEDQEEQEVLLELNSLELESLPNFTEIGHGIKLKNRPRDYRIKECPKYIQQFADSGEDVAGSSRL